MVMNNRLMRPKNNVVYHPEALDWKARVLANTGTVSSSTLQAVSDFCTAIDNGNLRTAFLRLNLICGDQLAAAAVPLYLGDVFGGTQYGTPTDYVGDYNNADYDEAIGIGDLSQNYAAMHTGLTIGTLATFGAAYNDLHMSIYSQTLSSGPHMGGLDMNGYYNYNGVALDAGFGNQATSATPMIQSGTNQFDNHSLQAQVQLGGQGTGFHLAGFNGYTNQDFYYRNGTALLTNLIGPSLYAAWVTSDGTPIHVGYAYSDNYYLPDYKIFSAYSIGRASNAQGYGLNSSFGQQLYNTIMATFQAALGRTASPTPLLDLNAGADAAYSLRVLNSSYLYDPVVRVRSTGPGSPEANFTAAQIDSGALASWVGAYDGHVKTWYDQSGYGRHCQQLTASAQPKIVSSGSLILDSHGKPVISFDGNDFLVGLAVQGVFILQVVKFADTAAIYNSLSTRVASTSGFSFDNQAGGLFCRGFGIGGSVGLSTGVSTNQNLLTWRGQDTLFQSWHNTAPAASSGVGITYNPSSVQALTIGKPTGNSGGLSFKGQYSEIIIYGNDRTTTRPQLEADIMGYYAL